MVELNQKDYQFLVGKLGEKNIHVMHYVPEYYEMRDRCKAVVQAGDYGVHAQCILIAGHPIDFERRNQGLEYAYPITVGNNVVIGGGSVIVKDILDNSVAVGNPCKVLRPITKADKKTAIPAIFIKCQIAVFSYFLLYNF